jgi:hypothetical protein
VIAFQLVKEKYIPKIKGMIITMQNAKTEGNKKTKKTGEYGDLPALRFLVLTMFHHLLVKVWAA